MKYPSCGAAKLVRGTRDISYTSYVTAGKTECGGMFFSGHKGAAAPFGGYKGETATIPDVRGDFCPACGESVLAATKSKRVSAAMLEFNKQVNASILSSTGVDPAFIARVRKKLALDQRQAAAVFGGGPNAFSRYENGKTKPPLAL